MEKVELTQEQLRNAMEKIPMVGIACRGFGMFGNKFVEMSEVNRITVAETKASPEGDLVIRMHITFNSGDMQECEVTVPS